MEYFEYGVLVLAGIGLVAFIVRSSRAHRKRLRRLRRDALIHAAERDAEPWKIG